MTTFNTHFTPLNEQLYLQQARNMAEEIIDPKYQPQNQPHYTPYYSTPYSYHNSMFSTIWKTIFPQKHRVDVYHHNDTKTNNKQKNKDNALATGAALTAAVALSLYSVGSEFAVRSNAVEDLTRLERDISRLDTSSQIKLAQVFDRHRDILEKYKGDSNTRLALKASIGTGLGLGIYACAQAYIAEAAIIATSPNAVLAGTALTVGGGLLLALKAGFDSTTTSVNRKAQDLLNTISTLKVA